MPDVTVDNGTGGTPCVWIEPWVTGYRLPPGKRFTVVAAAGPDASSGEEPFEVSADAGRITVRDTGTCLGEPVLRDRGAWRAVAPGQVAVASPGPGRVAGAKGTTTGR
ncbi:hypothetical protein ACFWSF_29925 [Streptomyces sp. NPDC058611]|uniref:hypothetical protein n=1 Tax=unclassified Streptomyces TaxID=2593676 RepID=UPI0036559615